MRGNRRHGARKAVAIDRFGQHRCSRYRFVDALDGIAVRVPSDEDDRRLPYFAKPPGDLDPFAATFEIDIHQDDIGLNGLSKPAGLLSVCR